MGHVKAQVSAVHVRGNMAVAHTVEEVGERPDNFTLERLKIKASQVVRLFDIVCFSFLLFCAGIFTSLTCIFLLVPLLYVHVHR